MVRRNAPSGDTEAARKTLYRAKRHRRDPYLYRPRIHSLERNRSPRLEARKHNRRLGQSNQADRLWNRAQSSQWLVETVLCAMFRYARLRFSRAAKGKMGRRTKRYLLPGVDSPRNAHR